MGEVGALANIHTRKRVNSLWTLGREVHLFPFIEETTKRSGAKREMYARADSGKNLPVTLLKRRDVIRVTCSCNADLVLMLRNFNFMDYEIAI